MDGTAIPSLVYYPDSEPGIRRLRRGRGFSYVAPDGTRIDDAGERARIASLAVPPAYDDVWICPLRDGHLQATGVDARARKQYRYHPDWTAFRARDKFAHLAEFGAALPRIRRRVTADLKGEAGERSFALAAVVTLIDRLALRVGHPDYAAENGSYGATTLRMKHVKVGEDGIRLSFTAKGGHKVRRTLKDRKLHRILQALDDLPGKELIRWVDAEGASHAVSSEQVNAYLAEAAGVDGATAKTFRTWRGTLAAFETAVREEAISIKALSEAAAETLHNTPTIARNSYIHPDVIALTDVPAEERARLAAIPAPVAGLTKPEGALLAFLEAHL